MTKQGLNRRWTEDEVKTVERRFPIDSPKKISEDLDRSPAAIRQKARRLGLSKKKTTK